jgi:hypothetical protein
MYVRGYLQSSENGRVVTMALNRYYIIIDEVFFDVGRLILLELHFIYKNKLYMFLIVKPFATA